jgi:mRNA-degrading endonuclease YafQ of YafQ-DinJ toxin-antitoxin module
MKLRFTQSFAQHYKKITKGNNVLDKRIRKTMYLLRTDVSHPSLRLHKITTDRCWSVSVNRSIRILIQIKSDEICVYHIGKHEDVY